jgi:cell division transport system permease protein
MIRAYFSRHAQNLLGSLGRLAAQPFATLMTMAVIAVALALPLGLEVFLQNARSATAAWNDAFELSVYLDQSAGAARMDSIARQLTARADVASVRSVTAAQALAEFREHSGFGAALDALVDNPLPNTLIVTPSIAASTPEGTAALASAIESLPNVGSVQLDTVWVARLVAIIEVLRRVVLLTAALLGVGVVLITGNTIRLDIQNRRAEIEVMKLVGGTDGFARRPFLYSGVWYGLGGGAMALVLVALGAAAMARPVARLAALYGSQFQLSGLAGTTAGIVLAAAGALGWFGSWLAATQHIRAIQPT